MTAAARNAVDTATATAHAQYSHLRRIRCRQRGHVPGPCRFPHPHPRRKEFEWVRKEYLACEQMALGKIKDTFFLMDEFGCLIGAFLAVYFEIKYGNSIYCICRGCYNCDRAFGHSAKTLLPGIQAELNHMRQTANLVSNEGQKLMDRVATEEKRRMEYTQGRRVYHSE